MGEPAWGEYRELPVTDDFDRGTLWEVSEAFGSQNLRFTLLQFDPGEGGELHYHTHGVEEFYFVVEGAFTVRVGDTTIEAERGSVVYVPPETVHRPQNTTEEPAVLLTASSPSLPPEEHVVSVDETEQ
jgi:mannose-6-phosphate isomerase-like protein (cupin superfamily)